MKTSNKKFPKDLYAYYEYPGTADEFLETYKSPEDAAVLGARLKMGHYVLQGTIEVESKAQITVK